MNDRRTTGRAGTFRRTDSRPRRGSVLYVVLVIIALLTLAAYQFSEIMLVETTASDMYARRAQTRAYADSGVERVLAALGNRQLVTGDNVTEVNLYANTALFHGVVENPGAENPRIIGRFSVVSPVETDAYCRQYRFGLADESGKLNLNTLTTVAGNDEEGQLRAQNMLMQIPGMTMDIADAILDWIDSDDTVRQYGAELGDYAALGYEPSNGPMLSLDELLLVRGVTPQMVFGFDTNRNGVVDPQEEIAANAAGATTPAARLGWSAYLTVQSKESNKSLAREDKINVNDGVLTDLYDRLVQDLADANIGDPKEIAKFIVAYRLYGPVTPEGQNEDSPTAGQPLASGSSSTPSGGSGGGTQLNAQAVTQAAQSAAKAAQSGSGGQQSTTRDGMDLSGGAKFTINSLYELVDVEVNAQINNASTTLKSPWSSANLTQMWPQVLEKLTTTSNAYIQGRVNVNQARVEVLTAVISAVDEFQDDPNLAADLARKITQNAMIDDSGNPVTSAIATRQSTAWLVTQGLVTIQQMRQLDRYLTTRGDVYRAQVIGFFDEGGPATRVEAVFDATFNPPRVIFQRDLTDLGKGFTPKQLVPLQ